MDIGGKGLVNINLTIPQGCSLDFEIVHKDDAGNIIDHSQSVMHMAFQAKGGFPTTDLSECCSGTDKGIVVAIPAEVSSGTPLGKQSWDLIVDMVAGDTIRVAYGTVSIVDTYALDEVDGGS